jgi:hypothetical protein
MENELIFAIGESILLEVEGVENVTYGESEVQTSTIFVELEDGTRYELCIKNQKQEFIN